MHGKDVRRLGGALPASVPESRVSLTLRSSPAQWPETGLAEEKMTSQRGPSILTTSRSEPRDAWRLRLEIQLRSEVWLLSVDRWVER